MKKEKEDIQYDSGEHPLYILVKIFKDLGFWSIIPLIPSAVAVSYVIKHLNRSDDISFLAYCLSIKFVFIVPCIFSFTIFHYLFNKYINK